MSNLIEINLKGIDDTEDIQRKGGYVHVYGVRASDVAHRLVGVAVTTREAADIMAQAEKLGHMPTIEVGDNRWFYVAAFGPSRFEKGAVPE
jgi:hypothetical protein